MLPLRILATVFTGTAQALIAPPASWTVLHWVAWVPFLWAISGQPARRRFWLGWLGGATALAAIFYWVVGTVQRFSNLPISLAIVALILFCLLWGAYLGFFALAYPRIRAWSGPAWPFAVAALFVACEYLNPQLFPFYQGVAHYDNSLLFQLSSITGVRGLTFLVLLVNGLVWAAIEALWLKRGAVRPTHLRWLSAATALLVLFTILYGALRLRHIRQLEEEAPSLRVGLVQLNLGIEERSRRTRTREGRMGVFEEYLDESRWAAEQGAQVVAWPEGSSPFRVTGKRGKDIARTARDTGIEMWLGGLTIQKDPETGKGRFHNSAFRFDRNGDRDRRYDKIVLLPFGEFMPGRHLFPELTKKVKGVGNFYPGEDVVVFETEWAPFNFLICYEAIRSQLVRKSVEAGSRFFVTITNDAWFGDTSCPHQHLMLTANRCAEFGCPMVRVATTGISAAVDTRGRITAQTAPYTKETLIVDVPLVYAPTLYTHIGDLFSYLCLAVAASGLLWPLLAGPLRRMQRKRSHGST